MASVNSGAGYIVPGVLAVAGLLATVGQAQVFPVLTVTHDDTVITQSCVVRIPPGTAIADANRNGVIQVGADGITMRFAEGSELCGAPAGTPWNELTGIGIRIAGRRGVTLEGARVHGFFNGLVATRADELTVAGGDFSDNYRQRLRSTPAAEDSADWLFPHHNDTRKWRDEHGGAVCIEASDRVTVREIRVRRGQNGILLDRVNQGRIYDNDCSFLSGWGLALWRSSRNVVSRNAFDFCVRGHVEGVYNRGQDSAGILCFEQCNDNVFAENSATHGGDGFFGFAGQEAVGERWLDAERDRLRRETGRQEVEELIRVPPELAREFSALGCNRNLLIGNDFSYAPAHGIELTFSEGNVLAQNRLVENAICGFWGGYSSDTRIIENHFEGNGGMAYGLERGGINMEHASDNLILRNTFLNDKCAIHLWWDHDAHLLKAPGVVGNYRGVSGNVIAANTFTLDGRHPFGALRPNDRLIVLQLRDDNTQQVRSNYYLANTVALQLTNAMEWAVKPGCEPLRDGQMPSVALPQIDVPGNRQPVGARPQLRGRNRIVMDEWGPWDHASPMVRPVKSAPGELAWDVYGVRALTVIATGVKAQVDHPATSDNAARITARAPQPGVTPYRIELQGENFARALTGVLVAATWEVVVFSWKPEVDPRQDDAGWRKLADDPAALRATVGAFLFPYGWGGPRDQRISETITAQGPGGDHFGMVARTRLRLPAGAWRLKTLSDDGVRVKVNGRSVIENWTWHGPTPNEGLFEQVTDGEVELEVEHFEIDGYAVLKLELEPGPDQAKAPGS